jgi:periplasmic divalent cation tolerance protein
MESSGLCLSRQWIRFPDTYLNEMDARVVYITCRDESEALQIGRAVVESRLAACANVFPAIKSVYWWEGALVEDKECVLVLKSRSGLMDALVAQVKELHSYSVPCVVSMPILEGNPDYLSWISRETAS